MKRFSIVPLTCSIIIMLTVLTAGIKEKKSSEFLRINDNIQNDELRSELKILKEEFALEKNQIQAYYNEKIEVLKRAGKSDVKALKDDFAERRKIIMKKYLGKTN